MTRRMSLSVLLLAAGAGLALMTQGVRAQSNENEEARNRALIQQSFDHWRNGTGSPYDLLAENAQWTITGNSLAARTYPSREAFMSEVIRPFNARMSSRLIPTVPRLYVEGGTVIASFDAAGTAGDGEPYRNTYAWFLEMRDGKIVRAHAFFDSIAFDALWERVTPASN